MRRYLVPALVLAVVGGLIWYANLVHARSPLVIQVQHFEKGVRDLEIGELKLRDRTLIYLLHRAELHRSCQVVILASCLTTLAAR